MVKCGVFFAIRTELLNILKMNFGFNRLESIIICGISAL
jgi:hypothetical protein